MSDTAVLDAPAALSLETPEADSALSLETLTETTTPEAPAVEVNWREEFKAEDGSVPKSLEKYKEKNDAVKAYLALEKGYSKKVEEFLQTATPEQKNAIRAMQTGAPEKADEYQVPELEEGDFGFSDSQTEILRKMAVAGSVTQEGFHAMHEELRIMEEASFNELEAKVRKEWGSDLARNNENAKQFFDRLNPNLQKILENQFGLSNPLLIWLLGDSAKALRSSTKLEGETEVVQADQLDKLQAEGADLLQSPDYVTNKAKQQRYTEILAAKRQLSLRR